MVELTEILRALGDPTRLRILRLLSAARLNVSEVVSVIGVAQSSVSHHLAKLKALALIEEERQAGFTYYSLAVEESHTLWPLIRLAQAEEDVHGDQARLTELLRHREDVHTLNEKLLEPGQSWRLLAAALSSLLPPLEVADFGCGTGVLSVELARWARQVIAVDRSADALAQARERAVREGRENITYLEADLHSLPLPAEKMDLVVISQSLHHVTEYPGVLAEAARILRPGGKVIVLELLPHSEEWVKAQLGHVRLGFSPDELKSAMEAVGLRRPELVPAPRDSASPFKAFLLTGVREERAAPRASRPRSSSASQEKHS
ncbi:MAG: ArsR/SmtB family transcription factor [Myxococcaceae bacterium]